MENHSPSERAVRAFPVGLSMAAIVLVLGAVVACERPQASAGADAASIRPSEVGRAPDLPDARRVVSLTPAGSRFVQAIGAESSLVGVDEASARVLGRTDLETVELAGTLRLAPDVVLLRTLRVEDGAAAEALREAGASLVEFEPHDFEELVDLVRDVGERLVGRTAAIRFERRLSRPLAEIGGASYGAWRPRVAPIVGLDPLELAGGHSFETDLIEIAGGSSVTHGGEDNRVDLDGRLDAEDLLAPDLVVYFGSSEPDADEQQRLRDRLPQGIPLVFFRVDVDRFWLETPAEDARRLKKIVLEQTRAVAPSPTRTRTPSVGGLR